MRVISMEEKGGKEPLMKRRAMRKSWTAEQIRRYPYYVLSYIPIMPQSLAYVFYLTVLFNFHNAQLLIEVLSN